MQGVRSLLEHAVQDVHCYVVSLLQILHLFYLVKLHHYKPRTVLFVARMLSPSMNGAVLQ